MAPNCGCGCPDHWHPHQNMIEGRGDFAITSLEAKCGVKDGGCKDNHVAPEAQL